MINLLFKLKKMRIILFLFIIYLAAGCKESSTRKSFSSADSLVIHFKDVQAGKVLKTVQTADPRAISRLIDFIEGPPSEEYKCGYDGKMFFYKDHQQVQEVDFQSKQVNCMHFVFMLDGKLKSTKMNQEAADFLDALYRGLPTYY